jgi:hypothetical protein
MTEIGDYRKNFVSTRVYEAQYQTHTETKNILVEERTNADGQTTIFTIIDQQPVKA